MIAHASCALVAVGGQYGTISEAAFGLHFEKPVFGLCGAPDIEGVQHKESVSEVIDALMPILLRLDGAS
jgi:predicted Rossmann-fold nucleotide-binding protein